MATSPVPRMRLVFDLDNTLYSYEKTGVHLHMAENITKYFAKVLNVSEAEAKATSNHYYRETGLAVAGLHRHHKDKFDLADYIATIHHVDELDKLVMRDEELVAMLTELGRTHDLWIFTNGDVNHATRILKCLECYDFFCTRLTEGEKAGEIVFKCMDFKNQWDVCEAAGLGTEISKPAQGPYELFDAFTAKMLGETYWEGAKNLKTVFMEDSLGNLPAAKKIGWGTVFVSNQQPASHAFGLSEEEKAAYLLKTSHDPAQKDVDVRIPTVHSLLKVLGDIKFESSA